MSDDFDAMMEEAVKAASTVGEGDLRSLVMLGRQTVDMKAQIDLLDEEMSKLKRQYTDLRQQQLPEAMAKVGLSKFTLDDGTEIKVEEFVGGGLPKEPDAKERALEWLVEHGGAGLIKTGVSMNFGRDQYEKAVEVCSELRQRGLDVDMGTGVHPQTLHAFVRERLRNGEPVDQQALGVFVGRVAKFKGA